MRKIILDIEKLSDRGYCKSAGIMMAEKLSAVNEMFFDGINLWLASGEETDYEIYGIKLMDLKNKFNLTYAAAILSMDWLLREPEKAKQSFQKGIR